MAERKPISKKLRFDVFKRDAFTCQYCGAHPPAVILHIDHINPVKLGGKNRIDNLVTACAGCNLGKAAVPLSVVPQSLGEKAAEAEEREAQLKGYQKIIEAVRERIEAEMWRVAETLNPKAGDGYSRARLKSIKTFIERLGVHDTLDAAEIMLAKFGRDSEPAFRYFCGVCWSKLREASA